MKPCQTGTSLGSFFQIDSICADQDWGIQGPVSIDQRPSHDMREPEEKFEHGFFVRNAGDWGSETGKEKGTSETHQSL